MRKLIGRSLRIYKIFGCYPMFEGHRTWNIVYGLFLCVFYSFTTIAFTYLSIHESGIDKELIIGMFQTYLQLVLNLNIIIRTNILSQFGLVLAEIKRIHVLSKETFNKNEDDNADYNKFYSLHNFKTIVLYIFFILILVLGYFGWGYRFPSGYILKQISQFYAFVTIVLQWQVLLYLQWKIVLWNKQFSTEFTNKFPNMNDIKCRRVLYRIELHLELLNTKRSACEKFNNYFGLHMLFQIIVSAQNLLGFIQSLIGFTRNRFTPFFSVCLISNLTFRMVK